MPGRAASRWNHRAINQTSMKKTDRHLQALVEAFASELSAYVQSATLEAVRQATQELESNRPATRMGRPAKAAKIGKKASSGAPARRGRKPDPQTERAAEVLIGYIKSNPGHRLEEIGQGLRTPTAKLKRGLVRLVNFKLVRTEGKRRGTRYFPRKG
jgi:hypothetical protein